MPIILLKRRLCQHMMVVTNDDKPLSSLAPNVRATAVSIMEPFVKDITEQDIQDIEFFIQAEPTDSYENLICVLASEYTRELPLPNDRPRKSPS